jgi:Ca2+-binding EF-hand superfamily protein
MAKLPEKPKTTDFRIHVKAATDVLAADMNGKSDPYCLVLGQTNFGSKMKYKSRVVKASLNPVWNFDASLNFVDPTSKVKIEVYDKDAVGKDDFLGEVEVDLKAADGKLKKVKLQGKKAKGEIEFSVLELGPYTDLDYIGPSWTSYFCDVIADSSLDGRFKLVSDLRREFIKRANTVGKTGHKGLQTTQVMDCIKAVIPSGQALPPDVFKLYEDNNDGVIDFFELCKFIRDIIKLGLGTLPKEAFATQVWFGFSYEDGQVDQKSLRKNLDTLVQDKEKKDPEKLNAKLDEVAEKMLKAMDKDGSGIVTADELREFSHSRAEFLKFVQDLNSVPDK